MIQIQIWERWVKIPQEPRGECWEAGVRVEHVNMKNSASLIDGQIDVVCLKWKLSECSSRQARKPCSISGRVHNHSTGSPVLLYVPNKLLVLELCCLMRGIFFNALLLQIHPCTHLLVENLVKDDSSGLQACSYWQSDHVVIEILTWLRENCSSVFPFISHWCIRITQLASVQLFLLKHYPGERFVFKWISNSEPSLKVIYPFSSWNNGAYWCCNKVITHLIFVCLYPGHHR